MKRFEYDVTKHPAEQFGQIVDFCTEQGECNYDELPSGQMASLRHILNERGSGGWELVQLFFGKEGVVAIWRRET